MFRPTFLCGLVGVAVVVTATAEDFPLTFRTIPAKEVMSFPGGSGTYGQLATAQPAKLRKEPNGTKIRKGESFCPWSGSVWEHPS